MKKLLFSILMALVCIGCKKDESGLRSTQRFEVEYGFYMNGEPSTITYTRVHDKKEVSLSDVTTPPGPSNLYPPYRVTDIVSAGDHVHLEMSTKNPVTEYSIDIAYMRPEGSNAVRKNDLVKKSSTVIRNGENYKVVLDYTFTAEDFN